MAKLILIYLFLLLVTQCSSINNGGSAPKNPPFWGNSSLYYVRVNMTNPSPVAYWQFDYYFDASRFNRTGSRYENYPPQFDEMCVDLTFPDHTHQCNIIYAVDGWTYIQFPDVNFCCKCENEFGSTTYTWLQEDSAYQGTEYVNEQLCEHWTKQGQYLNHYYCRVGDRVPVRFNELWGPNKTLKQWDFHLPTYNTSLFDPSLVEAPADCQNYCSSGPCTAYRNITKADY